MVVAAVVASVAAMGIADIVVAGHCKTSAAVDHPNCQSRMRDTQGAAVQPRMDSIGARWKGCSLECKTG